MTARLLTLGWLAALAFAQSPSPALLVLNKAANELAVVDPATGKVVGRTPVGESPHEIAVSADRRYAFVTNYGAQAPGQSISMVNIATIREEKRIDLFPLRKPHGIFGAGGAVYFTAGTNDIIGRYSPETNRVDWLFGTGQTGTHMVSLNKAMNRIITANIASNSVT